jgi:hypothetical protein
MYTAYSGPGQTGNAAFSQVTVTVAAPPAQQPTASLSATPSTLSPGQSLTYSWSSANASSWAWTMNIFKSSDLSHTVSADGCGYSSANWPGPPGGNSAQGTYSGVVASCQAGYTYNVMYTAYSGPGQTGTAASSQVTVTVALVRTSELNVSPGGVSQMADILESTRSLLQAMSQMLK